MQNIFEEKKYENTVGQQSVSIGNTISKNEDTSESIINRVDKALYKANSNKRNKVECAWNKVNAIMDNIQNKGYYSS